MTFSNQTQIKPFSVLLVDDNLETQNIFEIVLSHHELPFHIVSSTSAALDYLADHQVDVIIIDLVLPVQDGYQLFRQVRPIVSSKIVATTAYHTLDTHQQVLKMGFDGFLPKPLAPSTVINYLAHIVHGDY